MEVIKRNKRSEKKSHVKRCVPDSPGKWGVAVNWRNAQNETNNKNRRKKKATSKVEKLAKQTGKSCVLFLPKKKK